MKYFEVDGVPYHCDEVFNWVAVDKDGSICLYQNKPTRYLEIGYWDEFNCFYLQGVMSYTIRWAESLRRLT